MGGGHTLRGTQGPAPPCSVPAHRGVSFSPLGFPPSPPPEQHPTVSRAPPASLQRRVLWPSCLIAVAYGASPHPVCTFHSAPLPLVAHNEGDSGALPPSAPPPRRRHPTLQGLPGPSLAGEGGSGFSASRSAPPSPPSRHFAEAGVEKLLATE